MSPHLQKPIIKSTPAVISRSVWKDYLGELTDEWNREPTNTEKLVFMLIDAGLDLPKPKQHLNLYRVQPKVTGCEGRCALCFVGKYRGCEDIGIRFDDYFCEGIELVAPVKYLVKKGVTLKAVDGWLWVCLAEPQG